jgi:hypothetical protein
MAMAKQEIFNRVVTHLFAQGKAAIDAKGTCSYRAPDGCKCAVGCLLPDEHYRPSMEGEITDSNYVRAPLMAAGLIDSLHDSDSNIQLLRQLQRAHDEDLITSMPAFLETAIGIAERYELDATQAKVLLAKVDGDT